MTLAPLVAPMMPGPRFVFLSRKQEQESLRTLDPFTAQTACRCGSRERVYNNRAKVFCRRCGTAL